MRSLLLLPPLSFIIVSGIPWKARGPLTFEGEGQTPEGECTVNEGYQTIDKCVDSTAATASLYFDLNDTKALSTTDDYGCFDQSSATFRFSLPNNIFNTKVIWPRVTVRVGMIDEAPSTECQYSNYAVALTAYPPSGGCGPIIEDYVLAIRDRPTSYYKPMPIYNWVRRVGSTEMFIGSDQFYNNDKNKVFSILEFDLSPFLGNRTLGDSVGVAIQPTKSTCRFTFAKDMNYEDLQRVQVVSFSRLDGKLAVA